MPGEWSRPLLAAVTADVDAAKLRARGERLIWGPVAKLMLLLGQAEAKPDEWRKRYKRIPDDEAKRLSLEFDRDPAYLETVTKVIGEFGGASREKTAPLEQSAALEQDEEEEGPIRNPISGKTLEEKGDIIFEDRRPQATDADVEKLWNAYLEVIKAAQPFKSAQRIARATIKGNLPIGVAHFGDQHTGSWSLESQRMLEDYRLLAQTDGLYGNFMGDELDNFLFNFARWASVMRPDHQRRITEWLMGAVKPKALAFVLGNHLHWTSKVADVDIASRLAWLADAFYLGHRGDLHITVGLETYHFHLCHRAQGASALNKANSGRRTADTIGGADVIVEAHMHDPWLHQEYKGGKRQIWMRCGTYKRDDDYADELGFARAQWDMPMAILMPDTHRIIPYLDFRDGLDTLEFLRAKYKTGRVISSAS